MNSGLSWVCIQTVFNKCVFRHNIEGNDKDDSQMTSENNIYLIMRTWILPILATKFFKIYLLPWKMSAMLLYHILLRDSMYFSQNYDVLDGIRGVVLTCISRGYQLSLRLEGSWSQLDLCGQTYVYRHLSLSAHLAKPIHTLGE